MGFLCFFFFFFCAQQLSWGVLNAQSTMKVIPGRWLCADKDGYKMAGLAGCMTVPGDERFVYTRVCVVLLSASSDHINNRGRRRRK